MTYPQNPTQKSVSGKFIQKHNIFYFSTKNHNVMLQFYTKAYEKGVNN